MTASVRLETRLADSYRLLEIHTELTGDERGRRHNSDVLNRSVIVLTVAAWEGFVEDTLKESAELIADGVNGPSKIPTNVRESLISHYHQKGGWNELNSKTKEEIWAMTGRGWRPTYLTYASAKLLDLNTPNHRNVKKLFSSVLGLPDVSASWKWGSRNAQKCINELDLLLDLRHRIAHGVLGAETVGKKKAQNAIELIEALAASIGSSTKAHIKNLTKSKTSSSKAKK